MAYSDNWSRLLGCGVVILLSGTAFTLFSIYIAGAFRDW